MTTPAGETAREPPVTEACARATWTELFFDL